MKFWRQKQSGVMRIPSFEWVNILEYMNLVQYEKKYFSFFNLLFCCIMSIQLAYYSRIYNHI